MTAMGRGQNARVNTISVSADTRNRDLTEIAAAAALAPGTPTYRVDLDALNARIGAVPGVKDSAVRRRPDGNLTVRVEIYRAVAQWTDGEKYFPLSADGTIVRRPSDARDAGTVLFRGTVPDDISDITHAAHNMIGDLDYMTWTDGRRWNLTTLGGITVLLPEENPTDAIGRLIVLNKQHNILSKDIKIIDMRDDARILVK